MPGLVMMSMPKPPPASWLSAANEFMRKRIDWICDFGGSRPPRNPLTRIVAPGPAICISTCSSSSGSSGSSAISCSLSDDVNALPATSVASVRTMTSSVSPASGSFNGHRVGALLHRQRPFEGLKGLGLDLDRVCADRQALDVRLASLVDRHVLGVPAGSTRVIEAVISAAPV